ncbi:MAG: RNA polymerase sigma factor RpoD/SigA [Bacteroidales bacterium]|jgi:RNA polymerase primary sigma factor|nr:RNA polymerase sigma factor RpoD/SigA [Bacteroidales bacterium]MCK9449263.1 RNA polymerase sigma factor RpoD/SigA [Bacteroidales bacterium]MDD3700232.1 RNA polymerase sigma factor RpoD/SigA [Bacteroidales bacterium]MDY0370650.1 RNA polymerase sigma factor RpoD/SigA [Bacteroidales bacterium]
MRQLKITKSITNRENASLDKYLQDIGKEEMVTADEEVELARKIKTGDQQALERLVNANLRFVVSVAKQYQNQGLSLPDLINEGNLGLIKAASRFDETRGFKFISYAVWWIRQSILQALAEQSRIIRLPLNQVGSLNKIKKATSRLEQEFERLPSTDEIAEKLDMPEHKIENAMKINTRYISMDAPLKADDDQVFLDLYVPEDIEETDEPLMRESLGREIQRSLATLSEKERDVINMYYGIGMSHGYTLEEIGAEFDLTRERVRQIKEKAIRRLKHTARSTLLKAYLGQ